MFEENAPNWNAMEWENVRPGIRRKVFHGDNCTVVYNAVEPGNEPKPHSHNYEQVAYVSEGSARYTVGDTVYHMTAGSIVFIPPSVTHFIEATGDATCINIDVFTPRRIDYRQSTIKKD